MTSLLTRPARFRTRTIAALAAVATFSAGAPVALKAQAAGGPTVVVLVRHAEKATEPAGDPPLSASGTERAKALLEYWVTTYKDAPPSAIIVSPTRRTAETAAPLAAKFGITPEAIPLTGGGAAHVDAVANAVRGKQGMVVVVGHSNTIPAIVTALGGPAMPDLCDSSYSNMFILHPAKDGKPAVVLASKYGAADPAVATGCPAMRPPR